MAEVTSGSIDAQQEAAPTQQAVPAPSSWNPLSRLQVRMRTSKRFQIIVGCTTLMAVFIDILGTAIVVPVLGPLCAWAEGGPAESIMKMDIPLSERQAMIDQLILPDAFKDPVPPFKFSLAMNFVLAIGFCGSALGSLTMGTLCDKIGCKIPMQLCVFNGIIGYVIIYIGGKVVSNYYLFILGLVWNNFFGNSMGCAVVYMRSIFEPGPKRDAFVGCTLACALIGGSVGALIVMPFANNPPNGANFFNAIWLAIGLTVFSFLALSFVLVPEPPMTETQKKEKEAKANEATPKMVKKILVLTCFASGLDSAGDEGTRMARGTILSNTFPEWSTTERQNYLLLSMLGVVVLSMVLLGAFRKCMNLAGICVLGCFFTLAVQLVLMIEWSVGPFLIFWHFGKLFGFLSTIGSGFLIQEMSPPALLGFWNGLNDALTNIAMAVAPLIFAPIYDAVGNIRGQEMLVATSVVSLLATLAYTPLVAMLPKPPKPADKIGLKESSVYEAMTDEEYAQQPMEIIDQNMLRCIQEGKKPRTIFWGDYHKERATLGGLQERALEDFDYLEQQVIKMLTNKEAMVQMQKDFAKFHELIPKVDRNMAKQAMGSWIADYFDDAGYVNWDTQTTLFKSMIMNAFPAIDALDDEKPDYATMPIDKWEENLTKLLAILDEHLAVEKRRVGHGFSVASVQGLFKRR